MSSQHSVLSDVRDALAAPRGDAGVDARMLALDSVQNLVEQLEALRNFNEATRAAYATLSGADNPPEGSGAGPGPLSPALNPASEPEGK